MKQYLNQLFFGCIAFLSIHGVLGQIAPPGKDVVKIAEKRQIQSSVMDSEIQYYAYLPNLYQADSLKEFPVVYWLHGSGGWPPGAIDMLSKRFDSAIKGNKIPALLVIFLDDNKRESMWIDWKDGSVLMETVIINELVPHIDTTFRTINSPKGRILEGGSMGGYGAARFGFKYPNLFGAISMLNPGPLQEVLIPKEAPLAGEVKAQATLDRVYGGDIDYFRTNSPWVLAEQNVDAIRNQVKIRMILGEMDPSLSNNQQFSQHLMELKIPHTMTLVPNAGHSPKEMFTNLGESYWEFFSQFLAE
ncbi:alpha/beta hydrolase-fold protein [Ekhidna sp.]|uniref:alpha/beta hydrolase n=1 Tax=Ekhidna sp. TaxID=2608089 RepID=UPI0032EC5273